MSVPSTSNASSSSMSSSDAGNSKQSSPVTAIEEDVKSDEFEECESEVNSDSMYECNICLETAKDAVVSLCGHLFCWPCLHQWLDTRPMKQLCPVCKAAINKEKVIPLYGRGSTKEVDPRTKTPPRPAGQRVEPEPQSGFQGFGFGDEAFHMSFGIGAFPFGFFTSTFNFGEARQPSAPRGTTQFTDEQYLTQVFLWVAILFLTWLILA